MVYLAEVDGNAGKSVESEDGGEEVDGNAGKPGNATAAGHQRGKRSICQIIS